jgi:endonuclease G
LRSVCATQNDLKPFHSLSPLANSGLFDIVVASPTEVRLKVILSSLALVLFSSAAIANNADCSIHFANGAAPAITNVKIGTRTQKLCFEAFAVLHSGVTRTPLWSAEHLTRERLAEGKGLKRENNFHPEDRLPPSDRAELRDYSRSGMDRGHNSPSADMPTRSAQYDSFSLANMVPQDPTNNQNLWEGLERATRTLATKRGSIYVITGPMFEGSSLKRLNGRVLVPTSMFKAIYDPKRQEAAAYVTPNAPGMAYETLSISELEKRIGFNLFPQMPASVKSTTMELPEPTPSNFNNRNHGAQSGHGFDGIGAGQVAKFLLRSARHHF